MVCCLGFSLNAFCHALGFAVYSIYSTEQLYSLLLSLTLEVIKIRLFGGPALSPHNNTNSLHECKEVGDYLFVILKDTIYMQYSM